MFDEFEEEEDRNAIIDCDILEAAKENIQPLACGRRVTALATVLKTPHQIRNAKLEETRARFHGRVKEAKARVDRLKLRASKQDEQNGNSDVKDKGDNDKEEKAEGEEEFTLEEAEEILLDGYVRLVAWTIEHYPRGQSAQSGILELLEEATRAMRHSEYAKEDPRYLNLWIRYGTYVYYPEVIYAFLLANDIGTKWAKLYEEYAATLEKMNRRPKADEIYLLGIARKAEPLDHLEKRHREFQMRMMVAAPVPISDMLSDETKATPAPSKPAPRRRVLAESSSAATVATNSTVLGSSSSTFSTQSSSSLASQGSQVKLRANGRIPVFFDPDGKFESAPNNRFPDLGTRAERIKENRIKPEKMQGTILVQKGASKAALKLAKARARAAPKFTPYIDPEPAEAPAPSSNRTFEVFVDPEPPLPGSSGNNAESATTTSSSSRKFEVYEDPEPEPPAVTPGLSKGAKFVPFIDPDCEPGPPKITASKNPVLPAGRPGTRRSKVAALKEAGTAPRRSTRLNPKTSETREPEPELATLPEAEKDDSETETVARPTASFVPFQDEGATEVRAAPATSRTALRPKVLGTGASEAEALKKNPFKNYDDL